MKGYYILALSSVLFYNCTNNQQNTKTVTTVSIKKDSFFVEKKNKSNKSKNKEYEVYHFKNDSISIDLYVKYKKPSSKTFELKILQNVDSSRISGVAKVLLIEDSDGLMIAPEGTMILDEVNKQEYYCDSTYMYNSKNINISFSFEMETKNRVSLVIYNSKETLFKDNFYTLYKVKSKIN